MSGPVSELADAHMTALELADAHMTALAGEIHPGMVIALHRRFDRALDAGDPRVVLDLGGVTVLGGQTVSVLCSALRGLVRRGAAIALAGSPAHLKRVLERCAIDRPEHYSTAESHATSRSALPPGAPTFATHPRPQRTSRRQSSSQ